jgi:HEAT repeat protein
MPRLLHDRHPIIQAQAAEWAGDHPHPHVIEALLRLLEDDRTISRYAVEDSLSRLGSCAVAPLAAFIASHHGRTVVPALRAAARLADNRLQEATIARCHDGDPEVRALAADVLGVLGGTGTLSLLVDLLHDPAEEVRAAACRSLGRLMHWSSAPTVATLLRDPAWTVRREAGMALRSFGGPGILLLRRMRRDEDAFAADMARQVLDLPASHQGIVA